MYVVHVINNRFTFHTERCCIQYKTSITATQARTELINRPLSVADTVSPSCCMCPQCADLSSQRLLHFPVKTSHQYYTINSTLLWCAVSTLLSKYCNISKLSLSGLSLIPINVCVNMWQFWCTKVARFWLPDMRQYYTDNNSNSLLNSLLINNIKSSKRAIHTTENWKKTLL